MSVSPIGSQVHWIRMSSHGTAARVSPVQGEHQAPYLWVHSSPQVSRAPFPPATCISPEPLPTPDTPPRTYPEQTSGKPWEKDPASVSL